MSKEHSTVDIGLLKEAVKFMGVKWLFSDYDDTIADTNHEYSSRMIYYANFVASASNNEKEDVLSFMKETLNGLRSSFSVHPNLMSETARITALKFGLDHTSHDVITNRELLMEIYKSIPVPFEGVHETLASLRDTGLMQAVITHADKPWAIDKPTKVGLFFDKIFSIPSYKHKDASAWKDAIDTVGASPYEILAIGDSWNSDIRPALAAGIPARNIIRVKTSYSHSDIGKVDGIIEVNSFKEVPKVLVGYL